MKTTLNIQDTLLIEAKAFAAQQRTTLTRLIEEGLKLRLRPEPRANTAKARAMKLPTLPTKRGQGMHKGIHPQSNKSMYDAADSFSS